MERNDPSVPALVDAAARGDRAAWDDLVHRFTPLILSGTARFRLNVSDAADVAQTVWLRLVQHLGELREPNALPGWIMTTTRHECLRVLGLGQRVSTLDFNVEGPLLNGESLANWSEPDEDLIKRERHEALLAGFAELPTRQRELLLLLLADPPYAYAEISDRLGIPVGAIGPTRARALERLRHTPALAAMLAGDLL